MHKQVPSPFPGLDPVSGLPAAIYPQNPAATSSDTMPPNQWACECLAGVPTKFTLRAVGRSSTGAPVLATLLDEAVEGGVAQSFDLTQAVASSGVDVGESWSVVVVREAETDASSFALFGPQP